MQKVTFLVLDFGLPTFRTTEKEISILSKPPGLWESAITTEADSNTWHNGDGKNSHQDVLMDYK